MQPIFSTHLFRTAMITLSFILVSGWGSSLSARRKIVLQPRRDQPAPTTTIPGGRRDDGKCPQDRQTENRPTAAKPETLGLTPIVVQPATTVSLTLSAHPNLLVYVPATSAKALEITLEDAKGGIAQVQVPITTTPGIYRASLGKGTTLEPDKDYRWIVAVVCESGDPKDAFSAGIVRRVQLEPGLVSQINQAKSSDRVALYAKAGIWCDAIATLAELRSKDPKNPDLQADWDDLLKSVGLTNVSTAPIRN